MKRYLIAATAFVFVALGLLLMGARGVPEGVSAAETAYLKGENSSNLLLRQVAYNSALYHYLEVEKEYAPRSGNGKLYYNIGNVYSRLGEDVLALYYYEKAQSLRPLDDRVARNRLATAASLGLPPPSRPSPFAPFFFLQRLLSVPQQLQLFFLFATAATVAACLLFNVKKTVVKGLFALSFAVALFLAGGLAYKRSLAPIEAIVVSGSSLYHDADAAAAKSEGLLLIPGETVSVIGAEVDGQWLKIEARGSIGFVRSSALRVL